MEIKTRKIMHLSKKSSIQTQVLRTLAETWKMWKRGSPIATRKINCSQNRSKPQSLVITPTSRGENPCTPTSKINQLQAIEQELNGDDALTASETTRHPKNGDNGGPRAQTSLRSRNGGHTESAGACSIQNLVEMTSHI